MRTGCNEKLEKVLRDYNDDETDVVRGDVMLAVSQSLAADDLWVVPLEEMPEGMNETDFPDSVTFRNLPGLIRKTVSTVDGRRLLCAFTGPEKVSTDSS